MSDVNLSSLKWLLLISFRHLQQEFSGQTFNTLFYLSLGVVEYCS